MKASGDTLTEVEIEGKRAWTAISELPALRKGRASDGVRLLPAFDVYTTGTRPRSSLVDPRFEERVFRKAGWISPVVLIGGRAAGVWKHESGGTRVEVSVDPFRKLSASDRKAIASEADRLGKFLGAPASVTYIAG